MKKTAALTLACIFLAGLLACSWQSLPHAAAKTVAVPVETVPAEEAESDLPKAPETGMIDAGYLHSVYLTPEGTVKSTNYYQNNAVFPAWTDIIAVDSGLVYTVGLRSDGTVLVSMNAWPSNVEYEDLYLFAELSMIVSEWEDIVAVSAGGYHIVALKADGTVLTAGENSKGQCDVSKWKNITAISAGWEHTLGLKKDGTVVATGDNAFGQCDVSKWKGITQISTQMSYSVGLKKDGTVVSAGSYYTDESEKNLNPVANWKNIVSVTASPDNIYGLKSDGTLVMYSPRTLPAEWKDLVAFSADYHLLGMKKDGTILAHGGNQGGECELCFLQPETAEHCPNDTSIEVNGKRYFQCVVCGRLLP